MHQVGISQAAIHYYKKALETDPPIGNDPSFDLRKEAAFNLSLMYKSAGSHEMARLLIDKYIVV